MRTVLIIDDDQGVLLLISAYLSERGFRVVTAGDGQEGLERFEAEVPDLVFCDLKMPRLGGLEVLREVVRGWPFIPFVVVSGTNDIALAVEALKLGAWDYLLKPLAGLDLLLPVIARLEERAELLREKEQAQTRLEEQIKLRTAQLIRQLREKDLLLAEVHHRVKNNLQMILTLLSLQKDHSDNAAVKAALQSSGERVRALAMVQDEMHDADHATLVDARGYVTGMVNHLLMAHGLTSHVALSLDVEDLALRPNQAFICGLVLNELIAGLAQGEALSPWNLAVGFHARGPGEVELSLDDSRASWPEWMSTDGKTSLGWELVTALTGRGGPPWWDPRQPTRVVVKLT